jgi:type I restriction enzyme R subunit
MANSNLTEQETRTRHITPAVQKAGWQPTQIREEYYFTNGRIAVKGQKVTRLEGYKADYLLEYRPNHPLALIEAKKYDESLDTGMGQALRYAEILDVPFVYTSNGRSFLEHDRTGSLGVIEREIPLDQFPTPDELWQRYQTAQKLTPAELHLLQNTAYHAELGGHTPRYYQRIAINRTLQAIAREQKRILLVMATGTGKTYTAFQIIWQLWKAQKAKRVLFLADRNILTNQAMNGDFRHFGNVMTKIENRTVDKAYEIYLALYQAVTGKEEEKNIYKQFSPTFFDLIIIDECHRGSAAEDSAWRDVLEYFSSATQIGLTATPKETAEVSNIDYFGPPIYTYSLKQGIDDGFLAPYKVVRVFLDKDQTGWRPKPGEKDKNGNPIPDRVYTVEDFDRNIVLEERIERVAERITTYLRHIGNRMAKTIVFCTDVEHAERMRRALVNYNPDLVQQNSRYVVQITGGLDTTPADLDDFIDPASPYPVIVTTSKLLTTGVDAQTCQLIVLDSPIKSITEFRQIVGRGTRIREDFGKRYFTIMDFRGVSRLFKDPQFDGEPVQNVDWGDKDAIPPTPPPDEKDDPIDPTPRKREKLVVKGVDVNIAGEQVQYVHANGELVTETFREFSQKNLRQRYQTLESFLQEWQAADRKTAILEELTEQGVLLEELQSLAEYQEVDLFDLLCNLAFDRPPLTRQQRAKLAREHYPFNQQSELAQRVIHALLDKYAEEGIQELEKAADTSTQAAFLNIYPFSKIERPIPIINAFGSAENLAQTVVQLTHYLYS